MALACGPDLLIADEPTTALDVTIQQQILDLIRELVAERGMALILISHDLGVIAQNVREMLVMYGGSVVESGPTPPCSPTACIPTRWACSAPGPGWARRGRPARHHPGHRARTGRPAAGLPVRGPLRFTIPSATSRRRRRTRSRRASTRAASGWTRWPRPSRGPRKA
jgi:energy-coupling factor transporter ATP-binding protein EcfA2